MVGCVRETKKSEITENIGGCNRSALCLIKKRRLTVDKLKVVWLRKKRVFVLIIGFLQPHRSRS
jgi:hypothetical protein